MYRLGWLATEVPGKPSVWRRPPSSGLSDDQWLTISFVLRGTLLGTPINRRRFTLAPSSTARTA